MENILEFVQIKLHPLLQRYHFEHKEEGGNIYLLFESSKVKLRIAYNQRERAFLVGVAPIGKMCRPLSQPVVKALFNSSFPIEEEMTPEYFITNLISLLETEEGRRLLMGDLDHFNKVFEQVGFVQD